MRDMTASGKILISLTGTGEAGAPPFAANPGGAPANVAAALACCHSGSIPAMPAKPEGD